MKNISELLREEDPLQSEPSMSSERRVLQRQAILAATSRAEVSATAGSRQRMAALASVALFVIAALFIGARMKALFVSEAQAAVRFEIKLAEESPGPGLREAKVSGSDRSVYLHEETIAANSDISTARVEAGSASQYRVIVEFTAVAAEKMRAATGKHIGKPVAILLDGQAVLAPVVRTPIGDSAVITGNFTKAQAQRIADGITMK